jgi:arylsulfatase A-like enzyme
MQRPQITTGYIDAALAFMDDAAKEGKPFYINLWPDDVHTPLWPPIEKWRDGMRGKYLAVLEEMDRQLSKLFDHIRTNPELRDNCLILICSDNGPEPGAGNAGPFRGSKSQLYEGGIRSPLIAWGPGLIAKDKAGQHNDQSVFAAIDLVPSLLNITQTKVPTDVQLDGVAVPEVLLGQSKTSLAKKPLFFRRPPDRDGAGTDNLPDLAVREGNWKVLCEYDGSRPHLYDLEVDRGEVNNLAERHSDRVKRLTETVVTWHRSLPPDNGPALANPAAKASVRREPDGESSERISNGKRRSIRN